MCVIMYDDFLFFIESLWQFYLINNRDNYIILIIILIYYLDKCKLYS
jgi:hypothetical protein